MKTSLPSDTKQEKRKNKYSREVAQKKLRPFIYRYLFELADAMEAVICRKKAHKPATEAIPSHCCNGVR